MAAQYRIVTVMLSVIALFVVGVMLREMRSILLPLVIAIMFSILFQPVVLWLRSKRVPMALALLLVLATVGAFLFFSGLFLVSSMNSITDLLPKYEVWLNSMAGNLAAYVSEQAERFGIDFSRQDLTEAIPFGSVTKVISGGIGSVLSFTGNLFLILVFMLFILAGSGQLGQKVRAGLASERAERIVHIISNVEQQVRRYLGTKALVSAITGVLTAVILWILGVEFPVVWGVLAFALNFIPNVGSIIAVAFPFTYAMLQYGDFLPTPLLVLILCGTVQMTIGNVVEPKMLSDSLNLSALGILVSLILWGWLWGVWGMILSVPIMVTIKIILQNVGGLEPIAILMSGNVEKQAGSPHMTSGDSSNALPEPVAVKTDPTPLVAPES